ncbi:hypothetical protein ACXR0O_25660 [Verrucomicrobiota bacterium sgz303538]
MGSFTVADLPMRGMPSLVAAAETTPADLVVRVAKTVMHRTMMKALASRTMLAAIELFLDGSSFTVTALQTPMRMSAHPMADQLKMLCQVGVLQLRSGSDKRETKYVINPVFVRKAEDGTAIVDFGSGQIHFPKVRLRD